jgi:hypothetical protein
MTILLPQSLDDALQPIFAALPFEQAMKRLVVPEPGGHPEAAALVADAVSHPALARRPDLVAGLWLYVDELDKSHDACQDLDTPTGAYWHAIVHRREGDFANAKYWFRRAANHPALDLIDLTGGGAGSGTAVAAYDPHETVDRVQRAVDRDDPTNPALASVQHKEWKALFNWCVQQTDATGGG